MRVKKIFKKSLASKNASWPIRMNAMTSEMAGSKEFEEAFSFIVTTFDPNTLNAYSSKPRTKET